VISLEDNYHICKSVWCSIEFQTLHTLAVSKTNQKGNSICLDLQTEKRIGIRGETSFETIKRLTHNNNSSSSSNNNIHDAIETKYP